MPKSRTQKCTNKLTGEEQEECVEVVIVIVEVSENSMVVPRAETQLKICKIS